MTDELDIINFYKHRALTAEKKLERIKKYCRYVKSLDYKVNDDLQFQYYGAGKDVANHILTNLKLLSEQEKIQIIKEMDNKGVEND